MNLATNALFNFPSNGKITFLGLGEKKNQVSGIILMFQNIEKYSAKRIEDIATCIASYPKSVRCYLLGVEITSRRAENEKNGADFYDRAVKNLCNEILKRSESIGVRGSATRNYFVNKLGYHEKHIEIIFQPGAGNNAARIREYILRNCGCLASLAGHIEAFQSKGNKITYDHDRSTKDHVLIQRPYVTVSAGRAKLTAEVKYYDEVKAIWCETDERFREFLLHERADAFVCAMLPFAMRSGLDLVSEAPVTEQFLHNLNEILIPQLCAHDQRLYRTDVRAASDSSVLPSGEAVGAAMSCGIDSFYTASLYYSSKYKSMNLTHLYVGNYLYGNEGMVYKRAEDVANSLGLPLVWTTTNINEEVPLVHIHTHFFKALFGVLALRKLFSKYYYSTSRDFSAFSLGGSGSKPTSSIELLLLYTFSCGDFSLITGGVKEERPGKTRAVCSFEVAREFLNVCLYPAKKMNCGKCGKCVRTLLTLDMLGALGQFGKVFPIEEYIETREEKFIYLVSNRKQSNLEEVYEYFVLHEPDMVHRAEQALLQRSGRRATVTA